MSVGQLMLVFKILALVQGVFSFSNDYPTKSAVKFLTDIPENASDYRLPGNLMPTSYDLTLQPFLDNSTFDGNVTIKFVVTNSTNSIVLNIHRSSITIVTTTVSVGSATVTNTSIDDIHEMVTFTLSDTLATDTTGSINIVYTGVLREDMLGFYISTYDSGAQKMAITQFESTFARRAFPCFDEPAYRATFDVKIIRTENQTSLANMPLLGSEAAATTGWIQDTYQTTPVMPTYLVAFGVSMLSRVNNSNSFHIYTRESTLPDSTYLLSVGQTILDTIGTYLSLVYPLTKMDVVAVPDFNAGAMENWGLTTYREKYVLWNPALNTLKDRFGVLSVNAHEFAHQWFGDLVTPAWWDYSWLNEAFATYFEFIIPNLISPEWGVGSTEFVVSAVQLALGSDIGSPRPMTAPVATPDQIANIFDYVIYEKGGSILRMIENFLTTNVWKNGLNQYLNSNSYKTGTPEELFTALEAAATGASLAIDNLNQTFTQWTTQPGFPLITVTHANSTITNATSTQYTITQVPYNLDNNSTSLLWNVPIRYTTEFDKEFDPTKATLHWLFPSVESTSTLTVDTSGWVIFNIDQIGFYRVNYDIDNWIKLKAQLDSNLTEISDINRAQILDDALHLARTGHVSFSTALGLTEYLVQETSPAPWNALVSNFKFLINQFYGTSTGNGLQVWARNLMKNLQSSIDTSTYKSSLTSLIVSQFGCDIGISEWESYSSSYFEIWKNNATALTPELKQAVICTKLRLDTSGSSFVDVWKYFLNSNNAAEQLLLLNAMGCVSNEQAIKTYLDAVCDVSNNYVRLQDRWIAFRALLSRQTGVLPGLKYIASNYANVSSALGTDFSGVFSYMANTISQEAHITEVRNMIANSALDQKLRESLNATVLPAVLKRQAWAESSPGQSLKTWVDANVNSSAASFFFNICLTLSAIFIVRML